jgi:hypothetical protein
MKLSDYETTFRRVLYDGQDILLKTPQKIVRWRRYCAVNAATRFAQFAEEGIADCPSTGRDRCTRRR